jgi:hypothetical protein
MNPGQVSVAAITVVESIFDNNVFGNAAADRDLSLRDRTNLVLQRRTALAEWAETQFLTAINFLAEGEQLGQDEGELQDLVDDAELKPE